MWGPWLPGKAGGGREKDICEMLEASPPRSVVSQAGRKQEGWRELRSALGNAGELGDPKHPHAAPKLLSSTWELPVVLSFGPCLLVCVRSVTAQIPIPRRLAKCLRRI